MKAAVVDKKTDAGPAKLQPAVRPMNHCVTAFINANLPLGVTNERVPLTLDILRSPWPHREEIKTGPSSEHAKIQAALHCPDCYMFGPSPRLRSRNMLSFAARHKF